MINFSINGVDCDNSTKDGDGMTIFIMGFRHIVDEPYACTVEAILPGDDYANASAYALTPDGTRCETCTTLQYGCKLFMSTFLLAKTPQCCETAYSFQR